MRQLAFLCVALLAAPIASQTTPITAPGIFKGTFAESATDIPLGRSKWFGQMWYRGTSVPAGTLVSQLGWRRDEGATCPSYTHRLEIVLDNSPSDFGSLSPTFADNLSASPHTFLALKQVNFPAYAGATDPDEPSLWIPGDVPFLFTGPHLIVQVDVQTESTPAYTGYATDYYHRNGSSDPVLSTYGTSCGGTMSVKYRAPYLKFRLENGPQSSWAAFLLGTENQQYLGLRLPLDLGPVGMAGCSLQMAPVTSIVVPTDGVGDASIIGAAPLPASSSLHLFTQALHPGVSTSLGLETSNTAGVLLGTSGDSTFLFNWTQFGPVAEWGPTTYNTTVVLLLR